MNRQEKIWRDVARRKAMASEVIWPYVRVLTEIHNVAPVTMIISKDGSVSQEYKLSDEQKSLVRNIEVLIEREIDRARTDIFTLGQGLLKQSGFPIDLEHV